MISHSIQPPFDANSRQVGGNHYAGEFQHWDFVPRLNLCWQEGCATKYLARVFKKHEEDPELVLQDMEKVVHYLEKQIELLHQRVVFPFPNFQEYRAFHNAIYHQWILAQDFGSTNQEMLAAVKAVLYALADWSWQDDPESGLRTAIGLQRELIQLYSDAVVKASEPQLTFDPVPTASAEAVGADGYPNSEDQLLFEERIPSFLMEESTAEISQKQVDTAAEVDPSGHAGYNEQSLDPSELALREAISGPSESLGPEPDLMNQPESAHTGWSPPELSDTQGVPSAPPETTHPPFREGAQLVAPAEEQPQLSLEEALKRQGRLSLSMLVHNQPLSSPVEVYCNVLESLRRHTDPVMLDLGPRFSGSGDDVESFTSFRDYAEPLNKISLGVRTLEESIPNRQVSRTTVAMWAVLDGVTNLQHWLLRMTEGDAPVMKNEEVRHAVRVLTHSATAALHQHALGYMQSKGTDPAVYTSGIASMPARHVE